MMRDAHELFSGFSKACSDYCSLIKLDVSVCECPELPMRILLVEDDSVIANLVKHALTAQHYLVEVASDGQEGWNLAGAFAYDLILLDLMLPKLNGIRFCQQLRYETANSQSLNRNTPILLMTAEDSSTNRVAGLDAGADDYIVKPFDTEELLARVRALLRRGNAERLPVLKWGQLTLDPRACQVSYNDQTFHLSSKEYSLLELFLRHPQRIFSYGALIEHIWALEAMPTENAVRAQIKGLRKRLKEVGVEDCIETVYGLGYRLKEAERIIEDKPPLLTSQNNQHISIFWQQYREQYGERLLVVEQAVSALQTNTLTKELRQRAQREAHTLKGSLGLFGLDQAAEQSRQLEQLLQMNCLNPMQQTQLAELIASLRQALEQPLPTKQTLVTVSSGVSSPTVPTVLPQQSKLLIVDDDAQLLDLLQAMLHPWGFQVAVLSEPQNFWRILETVKPDLLMLDIEMPPVNGIHLCQEIRNDLRWEYLPILMISASTDDDTIQRVFMAGADDYVSKPIRAAELVARVIRRLEHAVALKRLRDREG
jgi:DNA-binding response OmpR family regulator